MVNVNLLYIVYDWESKGPISRTTIELKMVKRTKCPHNSFYSKKKKKKKKKRLVYLKITENFQECIKLKEKKMLSVALIVSRGGCGWKQEFLNAQKSQAGSKIKDTG